MELTTDFGLLTLVPPLIIIVTALVFRRTFEPLILGSAIAFIMVDGLGFLDSLLNQMMDQISENSWMWMVIGLFGVFSVLLTKSRGTLAFGEKLIRFANTEKKTLFSTFILGIVVFMDEYLNILTLSSTMMPISDRHKTPREMLAYVVDSTGTPVTVLIPISSWAVFYISLFNDQKEITDLGTGMEYYIGAIPYMFYAIVAVIMVPLVVFGVVPKMFAMKKAYQRVADGGKVYSELSSKFNKNLIEEEAEGLAEAKKGKSFNFLLPIGLLIFCTIYTMDLLPSLLITVVFQLILYVATKTMKLTECLESITEGVMSMIPMLLITIAAFTVKGAMDAIELPGYVVNAVLPYITPQILPAVAFALVAALIFVVGSAWGTTAIALPIFAPLAILTGASLEMTLGALICAATFGSHACFYTDATVLTSQACKIDNMEHALSQLPYAVISAVIATIMYIVAGFIVT